MAASIVPALGMLLLLSTIILGSACVLSFALRRRTAALRHLIWVLALAFLIVVPPAVLWLPKLSVDASPPAWAFDPISYALDRANAVTDRASGTREGRSGQPRWISSAFRSDIDDSTSVSVDAGPGWSRALAAVYALLAGGLIARLLWSLVIVHSRLSRLEPVTDEACCALVDELTIGAELRRTILLRRSDRAGTPWTWGAVRPVIVVPPAFAAWPLAEQRNALVHEIAHIRRFDFLAAVLGQICLALYWFQPLVWLAERARRVEAEYSADDLVVSLGASPPDYARQLLGIARIVRGSGPGAVAAAMAGHAGQFLPRVKRILDPKARREAMRKSTRLVAVAVGVLLAAPLVLLEPKPALSQENFTTGEVQSILATGPRTEAELDAALDFLIEGQQQDRARTLLVEWLSMPDEDFEGCWLCVRLIDVRDDSPAKRSALLAAFGEIETTAQTQASPDLLIRLAHVLLGAETAPAEDLAMYYLMRARSFGELSDYQKLVAVNLFQRVGQYDTAMRLVQEVHEDPASSLYHSQDTSQWIAFIESRQSLISRIEAQLSPAGPGAPVTYEYIPTYKQAPVYPPEASSRSAEGEVVVRYTVTAAGRTKDLVVVESTDTVFEQSALDSVANYRYLPRVMRGVPVDVPGVQVRILYRL